MDKNISNGIQKAYIKARTMFLCPINGEKLVKILQKMRLKKGGG